MGEQNNDTLFGKFAVEQGLCSEEELKLCEKAYNDKIKAGKTSMEHAMIKHGYVTKAQASRLKGTIKENKAAAGQVPGYKVMGKLGSGAMAVVYKAQQLSLDRTVAIKVLPKRFSEKPNYISRFFKEGKLAAKLNHNNIVQAIDVGEVGGLYYFVMEYVEGKTLYDDLAKGIIFKEKDALGIIIQLCNALAHAHAQGMIHRDVKPKNVMLTNEGILKLADMGLARETSDMKTAENEKGKAFGTPYYIAPEQVRGEVDIDRRADIYAVGATLFHMVTGRVPFEAKTPAEVMRKHLTETLTPPDHLNTSLTAGISEVIEMMMAKNKDDRYNTIEEALIDLEAIQNDEPPQVARAQFNLDDLGDLEEGVAVDLEDEEGRQLYTVETITRYRLGMVLLGAVIAILGIVIIFMAKG